MKKWLFAVCFLFAATGVSYACPDKSDCGGRNFDIRQNWTNKQSQSFSGTQEINVAPGAVTAGGATFNGGVGNSSMIFDSPPDFIAPYVPSGSVPLDYRGPYDKSVYQNDSPWFDKPKWITDFVENLPNGGKVQPAFIEKVKEPSKFFYALDARKQAPPKSSNTIYLGKVYCKSEGPDDTPSTVWGGCSRALLKGGCQYAYLVGGDVTFGTRSKSVNVGGGVSGGGIFGALFGVSAGAGGSNTEQDASPYERVNLIWSCWSGVVQ